MPTGANPEFPAAIAGAHATITEIEYKPLEPVDTAVMAKTSLYSPELNRFFVSVPHLGGTAAKVLVFKTE